MSIIKYILIFLVSLGIAFFFYKKYFLAPKIAFPNLQLQNLEGESVSIDQYLGKPVLVNFWATWCHNCLNEMADLEKASKILKEKGIETILISDESIETIIGFKQRKTYQFTYLKFSGARKELKIFSIPTTYLLDKNGEIIYTKVGEEKWAKPQIIEMLIEKAGLD